MTNADPAADRLQRLRDLFDRAIALDPADSAARRAFVEQHADSPEVAAEVLAMLAADAAGSGAAPWRKPPLPRSIGPHEVLGEIGHGAMGVVYRARHAKLENEVAIKVSQVPRGRAAKETLARFQREQQSLAKFGHDCIATILDSGVTDAGEPFLVMELVDGLPLTRYVTEHQLDLAARLRLFQRICDGVHHAHGKRVVHRDLKPDNLLIASGERGPTPKILDFGLAKLLDPTDLDPAVSATRDGRRIGTLLYMAPEQAVGRSAAVDERSDVYALGVILYELVCEQLPFSREQLMELQERTDVREVIRTIAEELPDRPSLRASSLTRRRELSGNLDAIIMQALAKEPERRYATARELAEDIGNHLADRPVSASPDSAAYRLRTFLKRHRRAVTTLALIFVTALVGTVVAIRFAIDAAAEKQRSEGERYLARATAELDLNPGLALTCAIEGAIRAPGIAANNMLATSLLASGELRAFDGHATKVTHLALSPDETRLISGDAVGNVMVWDYATGSRLSHLEVHAGAILDTLQNADGSRLAVLSYFGAVTIWELADEERIARTPTFAPRVLQPVEGAEAFGVRSRNGTVRTFDWDGRESSIAPGRQATGVRWIDPHGTWAISAQGSGFGEEGTMVVDPANGQVLRPLPAAATQVVSTATDATGRWFATVNGTNQVWLWHADDLHQERTLTRHDSSLSTVVMSADARWVAASPGFGANSPISRESWGQSLYVWSRAARELHLALEFDRERSVLGAFAIRSESEDLVFALAGSPIQVLPLALMTEATARRPAERRAADIVQYDLEPSPPR